jgi:hypothetical protein
MRTKSHAPIQKIRYREHMIEGEFSPIAPGKKPTHAAAARFLISRVCPSSLGQPSAGGLPGVKGQRVICDTALYHRTIDTPTNSGAVDPNPAGPWTAETASMRRPPPIHFLSNLLKTTQKPALQLKVAAGRGLAKRLRENRERFANRNEVLDEQGQPVKVDGIWLESFLTAF